MDTINERFKKLRKQLGYNQKDFASELSISRPHVSGIENGKDNPSSSLLKLICYKFNISEEWLINGIGSPLPDFDSISDEGLTSKYNAMKAMLESWMRGKHDDELKNSVQAFGYFTSIVTSKELTDTNQKQYLDSFCSLMDELERLVFQTYMTRGHKSNYKFLMNYKEMADQHMELINKYIRTMLNCYMEEYEIEIRF